MNLNGGIKKLHILAFFLMQLAVYLASNFIMTFMSYLLKDPDCYGVDANSAGSMVGTLSFYAYLVCFIFDLGLGTIMDTFGRKVPIIVGLAVAAGALIAMPYGYYVYPHLLVLR